MGITVLLITRKKSWTIGFCFTDQAIQLTAQCNKNFLPECNRLFHQSGKKSKKNGITHTVNLKLPANGG